MSDRYEERSVKRMDTIWLNCSKHGHSFWIKDKGSLDEDTFGQTSISVKIRNCSDAGIFVCEQDHASVTFNISLTGTKSQSV